MAVTRQQKEDSLKELTEQFSRAKGVVFAKYSGLGVMDAQEVRRGLRAAQVEYKVAKKTLVKLAAKTVGVELSNEIMDGPIGVAFGYDDELAAAQKMAEFAKKFEAIELKGGIFEGKMIDVNMVKQLAAIPPREVLLAKFMGSLQSPVSGFVGILSNVMGSFVRAVNAYQEKKSTESSPA